MKENHEYANQEENHGRAGRGFLNRLAHCDVSHGLCEITSPPAPAPNEIGLGVGLLNQRQRLVQALGRLGNQIHCTLRNTMKRVHTAGDNRRRRIGHNRNP
jgi:hypothetical protein